MSEKPRRFVSETPQRAWLLYLVLGTVATGAYFLVSGMAQDTI